MKLFNPRFLARCCAVASMAAAAAAATAATAQGAVPVPMSAQSEPSAQLDAAFGSAIASFRQGQFPDAYGRFIRLANLGHADAARYALLMCEHGLDLFGRDWDCAPHSIESWARVAGVAAPTIGMRHQGNTSSLSASGRR